MERDWRDQHVVHSFQKSRRGHHARPARKNRHKQFMIDGDAVLLTFHGISDFDALHSHRHDDQVKLYALDILLLDG